MKRELKQIIEMVLCDMIRTEYNKRLPIHESHEVINDWFDDECEFEEYEYILDEIKDYGHEIFDEVLERVII